MAPRPALERLDRRPAPGDWGLDELVSLSEAAALFFPSGPMTANALRIAFRRGELAAVEICGKLFTTPREVASMSTPRQGPATPSPVAPRIACDIEPCGPSLPKELRRRIAAARKRRS